MCSLIISVHLCKSSLCKCSLSKENLVKNSVKHLVKNSKKNSHQFNDPLDKYSSWFF